MIESDELERQALAFAESVSDTLESVLGSGGAKLRAVLLGDKFEVSTVAARGIALRAQGSEVLRIAVRYQCGFDGTATYLAVHRSEFHVFGSTSSEQLFRYEYVRDGADSIPNAHLQVHAHRDAITHALLAGGDRTRRARRTTATGTSLAALKALHFPLGGTRFRPCLEDVLHFLIEEFGVEAQDGWRARLDAGRQRWRELQLLSAVRDAPHLAVDALRKLGYDVSTEPHGDRATAEISKRLLEY